MACVYTNSASKLKRNILPYNPKLKELAERLRSNRTYSEAKLWNELKNAKLNGYDFDSQEPFKTLNIEGSVRMNSSHMEIHFSMAGETIKGFAKN
jgi:hypothetical protein